MPGDPVGDGLGPYPLSYPTGFTDYGDIVNAGSGASQSFRGDNNSRNLDVSKDGGDWQTVFFGTDWVPIYNNNAANGREVLERIIDWFGGCNVCEPPSAVDFSWVPPTPYAGEAVTLTGSAAGTTPMLFAWAFGDGGSGSGPSVVHTYAAAGDYTVTLTATNACGDAQASAVLTILEPVCAPVQIVTVTTDIDGCQVTFGTAFTGTAPYAWLWDFGAFGTSTATNPLVDFGASGTYPYTLTAANACGDDEWADAVTVACAPPCAEVQIVTYTAVITGCVVNLGLELTGTAPFTYLWSFGDGLTSTLALPTHTYAASGTYNVTVAVWNCVQGYDQADFDVTVQCALPLRYAIYLPIIYK